MSVTSGGVCSTVSLGAATLTYTYTSTAGCSNKRTITGNIVNCAASRVVATTNTNTKAELDFEMFPNPARTTVSIVTQNIESEAQVFVTDIFGKSIKIQTVGIGKNYLDVSQLSSGTYFISIVTKDTKKTKKLLVE